jgi:hypothetical protein
MKTISAFMLERFRLGELSPEDQQMVTQALAFDEGLRNRLNELDESDRELRLRYPFESFLPENANSNLRRVSGDAAFGERHLRFAMTKKRLTRLALVAAVALVVAVPAFRFVSSQMETRGGIAVAVAPQGLSEVFPTDRTKGQMFADSELAIYLKGNQEIMLPNQTVLGEGNTVQLAYTVPAESEHYGVIFSIDGRSVVTVHYPYRNGQSSLLVSGRRTFLSEAYILDDAPDHEVFVFVVSEEPLNVDQVLRGAYQIAGEPETPIIEEKCKAVFAHYGVKTVTILKN